MENTAVQGVLSSSWTQVLDATKGKHRLDFLKAIEATTRAIFIENAAFQPHRSVLGASEAAQKRLLKAALDQQWQDIEEYSDQYYQVYQAASARQQLTRACVREALASLQTGFSAFDACLLHYASLVNDAYDRWYVSWAKAVQGNETAKRLAADDKAGAVPKELYSHYTIISSDAGGGYSQAAYAESFPEEIGAIVAIFDEWIAALAKVEAEDGEVQAQFLDYLRQYRLCLAEKDIPSLEDAWRVLDEKWMQIRYWVQVVHDIEYGYGDPLRCKVSPEFSIRFMDEAYAQENATIQKIQGVMVDYFSQRQGPMARDGIGALQKSLAAIYYLPFQCGVNLYFRFSGQSIPNRSEVRMHMGVKIFFDAISTAAREESARELAARVLAEPRHADCINTVGTIVWHVAAHEIGHAIYGLDGVRDAIRVSTKTLLEEPRAELTALHTLRLLPHSGLIDQKGVADAVVSFMLQDLRRFQMFDSSATRPYTVSAIANYKRAADLGFLSLDPAGKLAIDESRVAAFLGASSALFEAILDAEDAADGATIEKVLADMEAAESAPIVQHLLGQLFSKHQPAQ